MAGGTPFWDKQRVIKECMKQLCHIIESKGIYSRKILREKYGISYDKKEPRYNGDNYISLCIMHPKDSGFLGNLLLQIQLFIDM